MSTIQKESPTIEHDELIDMRTHLTIAVLAATQLRRATKDVPDAARFEAYLDQALNKLVDDIRKVDALVAHTEASVHVPAERQGAASHVQGTQQRLIPRLVHIPFHLARRAASVGCHWAQRHGFVRLVSLAAYD